MVPYDFRIRPYRYSLYLKMPVLLLMFKTKYILYIFLLEISSKKYKKLLNHNVIMNVRKTKKIGILYIKKDPFRDKISSHSTESLKHYFDI